MYTHSHTRTHIHTNLHIHVHTLSHTHTHSYTCAHTCTRTHAHTHVHARTHTHAHRYLEGMVEQVVPARGQSWEVVDRPCVAARLCLRGPCSPSGWLWGWSPGLYRHVGRVGQNHIYTLYIYSNYGRELTKYTFIYGVYIRFWPTLHVSNVHALRVFPHACGCLCSCKVWSAVGLGTLWNKWRTRHL